MNGPTARFFAVAHLIYGGNEDAVGVAYSTVISGGFSNFGRDRRMAALRMVAPDLAAALEFFHVDVLYVMADNPLIAYRAVREEVVRAFNWIDANGIAPSMAIALSNPGWPVKDGWRLAVWDVVNRAMADTGYRQNSGIPPA